MTSLPWPALDGGVGDGIGGTNVLQAMLFFKRQYRYDTTSVDGRQILRAYPNSTVDSGHPKEKPPAKR